MPFHGGPRAMATLTGWARQAQPCLGGVPVGSVRTVPHRTVSYCLTAYDPHSSRPHFFKSGHTAWHGTKESTWYLARNYHEPSTVPARKRATGPSQPEPGIAPYYYVQHTCIPYLILLWLWLARAAKVASLRVPLYGTAGLVGRWAAAPEPSFAFQITHWASLLVPSNALWVACRPPQGGYACHASVLSGAVCQDLLYTWTCARTRAGPAAAGLLPLSQPQRAKLS